MWHALRAVVGVAVITLSSLPTAAEEEPPDDRPVVLVLTFASDADAAEREQRFVTELSLALDGFAVVPTSEGLGSFSALGLADRLALLKPLARKHGAAATIWIEDGKHGLTLLHLIALSKGRALVRIVEARPEPGIEVTLATAVEELLGRARLLSSENPARAIESALLGETGQSAADLENPGQRRVETCAEAGVELTGWSLAPVAAGRLGLVGHEGPSVRLGGGMHVEFAPTAYVRIRGGIAALGGPYERTDDHVISGRSLEPGLGLGLFYPGRGFELGGVLSFAAPWQTVYINLPATGNHDYSWWSARLALALELRLRLTEHLAVSFAPELGVWLLEERFFGETSGRRIVTYPRLDAGIAVGLVFGI
jgi:hypothetical protein